tara:strand:+ start:2104 stop:3756 length:1653 start_codon:yes stop_codon:yes gene_type:complete
MADKKKILSFDTTLRDPERIIKYLKLLNNYRNRVLDYDLILDFTENLISQKLYQPQSLYTKYPEFKSKEFFTIKDAKFIMKRFPQNHGAGGWRKGIEGWGARFYQSFATSNQLGFIHTEKGEKIIFGESGDKLISLNDEERGKVYGIFVNALAKFNSNNPKNANLLSQNSLPLLLKLLKIFKEHNSFLERREIPIILVWDNNNAQDLFKTINEFRNGLPKNISKDKYNKKLFDYCIGITGDKKVDNGKPKIFGTKTSKETLLVEYPSSYQKYLGMSNLIIKKRFKNKSVYTYDEKQEKLVKYIISKYLNNPVIKDFESFFSHISTLDPKLYDDYIVESYTDDSQLDKWAKHFRWEKVKNFLLKLSADKSKVNFSREENMVDTPSLALEWLVSLALKLKIKDNYKIYPRYHVDSEGKPTRHADGESNTKSGVDAIIQNQNKFFTLEPTLLTGTQQFYKESFSNFRHLKNELKYQVKQNKSHGICLQISPNPDPDTLEFAIFENNRNKNMQIIPISIKQFVNILEKSNSMDAFISNYSENIDKCDNCGSFLN